MCLTMRDNTDKMPVFLSAFLLTLKILLIWFLSLESNLLST